MASTADHPQTPAEHLITTTIAGTWLLWLAGGLYIAGPALGWILAAIVFAQLYLGRKKLSDVPPAIWLWFAGMSTMLLILWVGHVNFALGAAQTIKSSIGWAKGWALLALFPLAGAVLDIRSSVVGRSVCRLGVWTLFLIPIFAVAPFAGMPATLWVSPLQVIGGAGPEFFATTLYTLEPGVGTPRWQFFAPWSPAAGLVALVYIFIAAGEKEPWWRIGGIAGFLAVAMMSQSRLALAALVAIVPILWLAGRPERQWPWFLAAPVALLVGLFGQEIITLTEQLVDQFTAARADSSRVRATLARIAIDRWQNEAFWFGHGAVENGPHLVEYMPIGSHHSWYGLLFVKGLLGAFALAIPMAFTTVHLGWRARRGMVERTGFAMILVLILYSFGENLEILAYLCWPALLFIGMAMSGRTDRTA